MKEILEIKVIEREAHRIFSPDEGESDASGFVRTVNISLQDPRIDTIISLQRHFRKTAGLQFFYGWRLIRTYSDVELGAADFLHLEIDGVLKSDGDGHLSSYDERSACPICGAGATQVRPLNSYYKMPKKIDFVRAVSGEIFVSEAAKLSFEAGGVSGQKYSKLKDAADNNKWYQLVPDGEKFNIVAPTVVGTNPLDRDDDGRYVCPNGDTIGLNLISEIYAEIEAGSARDFMWSRQYVGVRRGVLRPQPILIVSQKVRNTVLNSKLKGAGFSVVHCR